LCCTGRHWVAARPCEPPSDHRLVHNQLTGSCRSIFSIIYPVVSEYVGIGPAKIPTEPQGRARPSNLRRLHLAKCCLFGPPEAQCRFGCNVR
jgi:hypothetical protein